MFNKLKKSLFGISGLTVLLALPAVSHAVAIPYVVTDTIDQINESATPINAIGAAALAVVIIAMAFKWMRRAA